MKNTNMFRNMCMNHFMRNKHRLLWPGCPARVHSGYILPWFRSWILPWPWPTRAHRSTCRRLLSFFSCRRRISLSFPRTHANFSEYSCVLLTYIVVVEIVVWAHSKPTSSQLLTLFALLPVWWMPGWMSPVHGYHCRLISFIWPFLFTVLRSLFGGFERARPSTRALSRQSISISSFACTPQTRSRSRLYTRHFSERRHCRLLSEAILCLLGKHFGGANQSILARIVCIVAANNYFHIVFGARVAVCYPYHIKKTIWLLPLSLCCCAFWRTTPNRDCVGDATQLVGGIVADCICCAAR